MSKIINTFEAAKSVIKAAKDIGTTDALLTAFRSLDEFKSKMEDEYELSICDFNKIVGIDKDYKDAMCA